MFNLIEYLYLKQKNNLVYYDSLTGARSRMYYDKVVARKYQNKSVKVIYIDINNLKKVNDSKGHRYGDSMIKDMSYQILNNNFFIDVCRVGGDEFVGICDKDAKHYPLSNLDNISYGVYIKNECETVYSAVEKAEKKMYNHKKKSKATA